MLKNTVKYLQRDVLKALILEKKSNFLVVDVRDDDYTTGNIKGAVNIPAFR